MAAPLPDCGLYRTGTALAAHAEEVPAGILVYFHNHSEQGAPLVLTPHANHDNRWQFHERGWLVRGDPAFLAGLTALKPQGLYVVRGHVHISREDLLPERSLVQLGYDRNARTILFPGRMEGNAIRFPERGYGFDDSAVQKALEPVDFRLPEPPPTDELH